MEQFNLTIKSQGRGYYLITNQIQDALNNSLAGVNVGLLHVFLQHSSASLTINENADPTVREDFKNSEEKLVPRSFPYKHDYEMLMGRFILILLTNSTHKYKMTLISVFILS